MISFFSVLWSSFLLGVLTPTTAVCVLPLYPGFLSFMANQLGGSEDKKNIIKLGLIVVSGVVLFMLLLGLIFTTLLQSSLTKVVEVVSPIAFIILMIISILLIFNVDFARFMPHLNAPTDPKKGPKRNAFLFGFFFGAIVLPCNPGFIAAFFATAFTVSDFAVNMANFLAFGVGIGLPLFVLSVLSVAKGRVVIDFLIKYKRWINLAAGVIMLVLSLYFLVFDFLVLERWFGISF